MNSEEGRGGIGMFAPRKALSRSNSSSSVSSTSSNSSATTVASNGSHANGTPLSSTTDLSQWSANGATRKRPQPKTPWPPGKGEYQQQDMSRLPQGRAQGMMAAHGPVQAGPGQVQMTSQGMMRPMAAEQVPPGQPVLYLLSLNGTFERKTIAVPFAPESLRIGRQTNQKTIPTPTNGFFDSKVLSRQHAEIYAERNGKIYIRDVKSSNGTFVNGTRLSQENRESEPHELQTSDHLELGIDIVSEDQKTVVHHKVAAKVEHAGFMSASSNVMDMNFGDLDPANGAMMMPSGPMQLRGRTNSNASMASNGRMMPNGVGPMNMQANGMPQQRPFFLTPVATDQILKRLANEMRNARLQAQDLGRTNQFVHTLLSKDDLKDLEKSDGLEQPKPQPMVNGMGTPFRADPKTRFSDPPAPPPQQPLPEKPDVPSLKRGPTERPKSGPPNSPVRPDNLSQIVQLTEALNNAKRDIDSQTARMRELEEMLQKERIAREEAEELAKRLEESATTHMNGSAVPGEVESYDGEPEVSEDENVPAASELEGTDETTPAIDTAQETAADLQSRIDMMESQMREMKEQMQEWKQRCDTAETERDADRKTLAEMVVQLRAEEALREAAESRARSRSRKRDSEANGVVDNPGVSKSSPDNDEAAEPAINDDASDKPTLSRANTITPSNQKGVVRGQDQRLQAALPYASVIGVVLFGMGLMAYINGWQAEPPRPEQ
ncbi:hypothetical protein ACHAPU_003301 [Fusarium lateritium]